MATPRCEACVWYRDGGCGMQTPDGGSPEPLPSNHPICEHFATGLDCLDCGACCREAYDSVPVGDDEIIDLHPELIRWHNDGWVDLQRVPAPGGCGTICAALNPTAPFTCRVYAVRPTTCREVEPGGEGCLFARRRLGLSPKFVAPE